MRLTKKSCLLLLVILGVIVLWMLFPLIPLDLEWGSKHIDSYSWLDYTDADGGPENKCDCPAILQGDSEALEQAKTLTTTKDFQKSITIPNEYYINASQACRNFKASRKYLMIPLSRVEEDFPLAYSIVVHKDDIVAVRECVIKGLCIYLNDNSDHLVQEYVDMAETDFFNSEEMTTVGIYVVKGTANSEPSDVGIVIEGVVALRDLENVALASAMLFGLFYALNMQYPTKLRYTFEVIQKLTMEVDAVELSRRLKA